MTSLLPLSLAAGISCLILSAVYFTLMCRRLSPGGRRTSVQAIYALSIISTMALMPRETKAADYEAVATMTPVVQSVVAVPDDAPADRTKEYVLFALQMIFTAGMAIATAIMVLSVLKIRRISRGCTRCGHIRICRGEISPFAWAGRIYISEKDWNSADRSMILAHEQAHVDLRHSADLALAHVFGVLCWYNPAAWALLKELHIIHEYQADRTVVSRGGDVYEYQMFLINKAADRRLASLADSLHHSNLKKRITMMMKNQNKKAGKATVALLAPAVVLALAAVNSPIFAEMASETAQITLPAEPPTASGSKVSAIQPKNKIGVRPADEASADSARTFTATFTPHDNQKKGTNTSMSVTVTGGKKTTVKVTDKSSGETFNGPELLELAKNEGVSAFYLDNRQISEKELKSHKKRDITTMVIAISDGQKSLLATTDGFSGSTDINGTSVTTVINRNSTSISTSVTGHKTVGSEKISVWKVDGKEVTWAEYEKARKEYFGKGKASERSTVTTTDTDGTVSETKVWELFTR